MLGDIALKYYKQGESCSKCIFKACEDVYKIKLPNEIYEMCGGLNNGFGVGGMCSAAVTSVMFAAFYLGEDENRARIYFLTSLQEKMKSTACGKLKKNCGNAIKQCGDLLEETIEKFK